jgi:hypothetical protein
MTTSLERTLAADLAECLELRDPWRNVVDKAGYLRTALGLTFPFPLVRRGLGPAGTAGTTGMARCSTPGWTTGGVRKIPAEARSTVRPALAASSANSSRAAAFAATSTGTFVAPLSIRTTVAMPRFILDDPSA